MQQKAKKLKNQSQQTYLADLRNIGDSESNRRKNNDSKSAIHLD